MRNYQETVQWLFQQLPMFQQVGNSAYKVDLTNIRALVRHLQEPHQEFKTIHVAGTNGKGSVSHMLASVLQESGYRVGLYTSPHLKDFRERIKVDGKEISEAAVIDFVARNEPFFQEHRLSFFEMTVGLAFEHFRAEAVDVAVVEVGLGGRLDSTNIITPELSVITNIGFDHTQILGDSLAKIAGEKAGIIKKGVPVVIGEKNSETSPVFRSVAKNNNAPLYFAEDVEVRIIDSDLKGYYQKKNIRTTVTALKLLKEIGWGISPEAIQQGIGNVVRNTGLRGRWEVLRKDPKVICDTAHNKEGLEYAMAQLQDEEFEILHLVLGVVSDKDLKKILPLLPKQARYYFCRPNIPRGMEAERLMEAALQSGLKGEAYNSVSEAYAASLESAGKGDVIYVGGSTFTVAEII